MNVLIIGNGAREHAISKSLKKSRHNPNIFVFASAKNPGIFSISSDYYIGNVKDHEEVCNYAVSKKIDFAIIGPENPLADGIVDTLNKNNIKAFGPTQELAQLETSKGFTRTLLNKYGIPGNPDTMIFSGDVNENKKGIEDYLKKLNNEYVIKYDALLGGKGVKLSGEHLHSIQKGIEYACDCLEECGKVVIEEKLIGEEFSLISIVDGDTVLTFPAVQDHKRAFDGDVGPNTGGMGTYSDSNHLLPFLTQKDIDEAENITKLTMKALEKECGSKFVGVMYGGFIATQNGIKLIEYNARFGDPEALNLLSILETDFVDLCLGAINHELSNLTLVCQNAATVCKYVVPEGYPENSVKGENLTFKAPESNVEVYYGAVDEKNGELLMTGSRAIGFVGVASTLQDAVEYAQQACKGVTGKVFFRKDIGTQALIEKRVQHMKELRG